MHLLTPLKTPKEAANLLRVSERWLARGRCEGFGPAFTAIGHRTVRYTEEALVAWIASHNRKSTSDDGGEVTA